MADILRLGSNSKRKQAENDHDDQHEGCKNFADEKHNCAKGFGGADIDTGIQAVIDSIPAYVIIVDDHHRIIMANKIVKETVGLDSTAINGAFCPKLLHGLTKPFHGCPLEDAKKIGGSVEKEMFDSDTGKWLRSTVYPMSVQTRDKRNIYLHIVFDITEEKKLKEERAELDKIITLLLDSTDEGIYGVNNDGKCIFANKASARLTGYPVEEILGKTVDEFLHNNNDNPASSLKKSPLSKTLNSGRSVRVDDEVICKKDGSNLPVEYSSNPIVEDNEIEGAVVTFTDISERKKIEIELKKSEKRFRAIVEQSKDGIIMETQSGEIALYNESAREIFGYSTDEVNEHGLFKLIVPEEKRRAKALNSITDAIQGKIPYIDIPFTKKDGTKAWVSISGKPLSIGDAKYDLLIASDITKRKEAEDRVNYLAYYDIVTGLPNKTLLLDRLSLAIANVHRNNNPLAVIYFALNNFRTVLDTLGHDLGDELLKEVTNRFYRLVSKEKTLAYLGSGEFVLLMPNIEFVEEAARFAALVNDTLKPEFWLRDNEVHVTASFGISLCPEDGVDSHNLLKNADAALTRAQEKGNGNYEFYEVSMNSRSAKRLSLEGKLHKALENDEFLLYYQPQVDMISNNIKGVEALIRWQSPDLGFVSPLDFISIAEDVGLIVPIGEWVLKTACRQNKEWQKKGYPAMRMGVNLSAKQFQHKTLVNDIELILRDTELNPAQLELEITEGVMINEETIAFNALGELKEIGIKVAVDDFGTGYSSLGYLRRYPIDRLKIDKVFIDNITSNANDKAIVEAIISVARALSLDVIAEGVETEQQLETLRSLRCDEIQGYLFSKPLPASELEVLLKNDTRLCA